MQWQRAANDMVPVRRHFDDHTELKLIVRLAVSSNFQPDQYFLLRVRIVAVLVNTRHEGGEKAGSNIFCF